MNEMKPSSIFPPYLAILFVLCGCDGLELVASVSQRGLQGDVRLTDLEGGRVKVTANLSVAEGAEGEYTWGIYEFPIDYTQEDYCDSVGRRPKINLEDLVGKLSLPSQSPIILEMETVSLFGEGGVWGSSLVLEGPGRERICATLIPDVDERMIRVAEARFTAPVAGSVFFHSLRQGNKVETKILSTLYHVVKSTSSEHSWQIFITDIVGTNKRRQTCNFLQLLYDPDNRDSQNCSKENPDNCKGGDLTGKFGKVKVGKKETMFTKKYMRDSNLRLPEMKGSRSLYLALFDPEHENEFFACAEIHDLSPRVGRAKFRHDGIRGHISLTQRSQFHPVISEVKLTGLSGEAGSYHIHEFPVPPRLKPEDAPCGATGGHYNPFRVDKSMSPPGATGTSDKYEVGDLAGKYGDLKNKTTMEGTFVDPALSLFGARSVVGRSVVIHHSPIPHRWVCANIELEGSEMITAVASFVYPIAGRIIFRQDVSNPLSDTFIYVEGLLYSDGTKNESDSHPWHVHEDIPGKDFFNWTGRCNSAGNHFNPYRISHEPSVYRYCESTKAPGHCEVGDLQHKHAGLKVAGRRRDISGTRRFFTDSSLPLTGSAAIIGHSIVIHDDHAPKHRGNRMACTEIKRLYRHKAVAREWYGNGIPPPVSGRLEFIQDTEMSLTHSLVELDGMEQFASSYHVHEIPVQSHLEFACSGAAVGAHFNPWNKDHSASPAPGTGTPDQYEAGDLSGKYGSLDGKMRIKEIHNDTNLPMFGSQSIVGRSIVIHKKLKGERWACSSIGWGWDPDEATQVTAIASFHHPLGFAWGYIRFSQVIYKDGSSTNTAIEVRLKYPGKTNQDETSGHKWSVYVNPVGHDASVKFVRARCTAGGYRWNPTFIQLADPADHGFYSEECSPETPLRCEVGDLTGRHGKLNVGGKAYVFSDVNLPLSGDWYHTALGKSIIIHGQDGTNDIMACANIEPDNDIIKFVVLKTVGGFNLAQFMEDVQGVMGVPEWFMFTDARQTKLLHEGRCLQVLLHFRGPHASKLEQDLSKLLRTGKLDTPSLFIPGYFPDAQRKTRLGYRECGGRSINRQNKYGNYDSYGSSGSSQLPWLLAVLLAAAVVL